MRVGIERGSKFAEDSQGVAVLPRREARNQAIVLFQGKGQIRTERSDSGQALARGPSVVVTILSTRSGFRVSNSIVG